MVLYEADKTATKKLNYQVVYQVEGGEVLEKMCIRDSPIPALSGGSCFPQFLPEAYLAGRRNHG